jgi:hypothetical protein
MIYAFSESGAEPLVFWLDRIGQSFYDYALGGKQN